MNLKSLLQSVYNWFKELFSKDENQSEILKVLVNNSTSADVQAIKDSDLGERAIAFVKELNERTDLTGSEKAKIFNEKLAQYAKQVGKVVATHAINLLRELAVTAVKIAATAAITSLLTEEKKSTN